VIGGSLIIATLGVWLRHRDRLPGRPLAASCGLIIAALTGLGRLDARGFVMGRFLKTGFT
jgi:hypothetical protein